MSQAVVDVLVGATRVVKGTKARHAFVIAKGLTGIFRTGNNPLTTDSPYMDESAAVELMQEIIVGVDSVADKYSDVLHSFREKVNYIYRHYMELMEFTHEYLTRPHQEQFVRKARHFRMILSIFAHDSSLASVPRDHFFGRLSLGDFTWGFSSICELYASMLALIRVIIEIVRRVLPDDEKSKEFFDDIDKSIDKFDDFVSDRWISRVGELQKLPQTGLKATPTTAVSYNGQLYFVTSPNGKLVRFVEETCSEEDTGLTLTHITQLATHKEKLYCIVECGSLYEIDLESGQATPIIEDTPFRSCTSMVGLGDFLYVTLDQNFYSFYRIDPIERSIKHMGHGWCGAQLATVEFKDKLFARYRHFLWDTIFEINHPHKDKHRTYFVNREWKITNEPNLVGLGGYLYTQGGQGDVYIVTLSAKDDAVKITHRSIDLYYKVGGLFKEVGDSDRLIPLTSHKLSLVCLHKDDSKFSESHPHLSILRPFWIHAPWDWFKKMMANGGLP